MLFHMPLDCSYPEFREGQGVLRLIPFPHHYLYGVGLTGEVVVHLRPVLNLLGRGDYQAKLPR